MYDGNFRRWVCERFLIDYIQQQHSNIVKRSNLPGKGIAARAEACVISFSIMRKAAIEWISDDARKEDKQLFMKQEKTEEWGREMAWKIGKNGESVEREH